MARGRTGDASRSPLVDLANELRKLPSAPEGGANAADLILASKRFQRRASVPGSWHAAEREAALRRAA